MEDDNGIHLSHNRNVGKKIIDVVMPNIEDIGLIDKHYAETGRLEKIKTIQNEQRNIN
jgi:hypothetical protein